MNKGQSGIPQWVVLMILGVCLSMIVGATFYSAFVESQKSKNSFDDLTEKINALKDGETLDYLLDLDHSNILISFKDGKDYIGPDSRILKYLSYDCKQGEKIKVSPSCGSYSCLCICDTSMQYDLEASCTEHALVCYPFVGKTFIFEDPTCPSGVYQKGENNGILQLYIQLKGKTLSFCENKDCISNKDKLIAESFSNFVNQYQSCLDSESTCTCDLDYTFLTSGYALNFYPDRIELYDAGAKSPITSESFTINIDLSVPGQQYTDVVSLYLFEDMVDYSSSEHKLETMQLLMSAGKKYFVVSTSTDDILTFGFITDKQIPVQTKMLFKDNKLYFTSEDLSSYTSCSIDKRLIL